MSQPVRPLSPHASPTERRAQIEQSAPAQQQPTTLAGWREMLGPVPPPEEGEASMDEFEAALREIRKGKPGVPPL